MAPKYRKIRTIKTKLDEIAATTVSPKVSIENRSIILIGKNLTDWKVKNGPDDKAIKEINLSKNNLTTIPSLETYTSLENLNVSRNCLTSIGNIVYTSLSNIREVDLSRNQLTFIPQEFTQLSLLEVLFIHHNQLVCIPEGIENLRLLRHLDASYNKITRIENELEGLLFLDILDLSYNDISIEMLGPRTRRLCDKKALFSSKDKRRVLIQRGLCVRRNVLNREQQVILASIQDTSGANVVGEFP